MHRGNQNCGGEKEEMEVTGDHLIGFDLVNGMEIKGPDIENPFESIECSIAFQVRDMLTDRRDAWIYGIVFGFSDVPEDPRYPDDLSEMEEVARKHNWSLEDMARLRRLHAEWEQCKKNYAEETI